MHSEILTSDPLQAQRVRNLQILLPRIKAIGDRYGCAPCRAIFRKKTDIQLMDDLIYPLGTPVSRKAGCTEKPLINSGVVDRQDTSSSLPIFPIRQKLSLETRMIL